MFSRTVMLRVVPDCARHVTDTVSISSFTSPVEGVVSVTVRRYCWGVTMSELLSYVKYEPEAVVCLYRSEQPVEGHAATVPGMGSTVQPYVPAHSPVQALPLHEAKPLSHVVEHPPAPAARQLESRT